MILRIKMGVVLLGMTLAGCAGQTGTTVQSGGQPSPRGGETTTAAISETDLRGRLYKIADDSMVGRATGSIGHVRVTEYIAAEMKRLGLNPAGDNGTYFQSVPFVTRKIARNELSVAGEALAFKTDFLVNLTGSQSPPFSNVDVIYGGIVSDSATWITREQAAGKFVIFGSNLQRGLFGPPTNNARFREAAALGVTGFGPVWTQLIGFLGEPGGAPTYKGGAPVTGTRPIAYFLSNAGAEKLLGGAIASMQAGMAGKKASGALESSEAALVARNVVAILPGSDPNLRGQYVAVGAHSDHDPVQARGVDHDSLHLYNAEERKLVLKLGREPNAAEVAAIKINLDSVRAIRPVRRDSIRNGADDDGSGTVAVLEIAEAIARGPAKPARSIIFVWHVAEELGLIGASYFTEHPTVPRDSIVAQLNIDMIGRGGAGEEIGGGPDYLQLIGWRRLSNELGDVIEAVNRDRAQPFKFDLTYDATGHPEQYYCRSDHYMYARYGIPIAFFTTGSHGDYHQNTDEPQYIDYLKLRNVTQLINDIALRVAGLDHRVKVDGPKPDPTGQCRQ